MAESVAETIRPLRRVEYARLVDAGVFENERVELLDGEIVVMSPIGPPHNAAVQWLTELLVLALHGKASVRPQMSFAASEYSQPEPDLTVVPRSSYLTGHPGEAHLIIEVSDSSLAYDRGRKLRVYARCGVREYWIVNVRDQRIQVYTAPEGEAYTVAQSFERGQAIRIGAFPDVEIRLHDVFRDY